MARVTLLDKAGYKQDYFATVAGALKSKDLLVLKIDAPRELLQPVTLGASADVRVGQQVLAIGNPFGACASHPASLPYCLNRCVVVS